jgi:hypothetical protein
MLNFYTIEARELGFVIIYKFDIFMHSLCSEKNTKGPGKGRQRESVH